MRKLLLIGLAGLVAQLVDGSLGMAYGVTSTTVLLTVGLAPVTASATVHLAEVGTTLASGIAHWRFGNVDWRVVSRIAVPGAVGAFAGATALSALSTELARPWMAAILTLLGGYLLIRFTFGAPKPVVDRTPRRRFLVPLGVSAGFLDATGGGGWGPVATPALLASGRLQPRTVVGSVDTSEFLVALAASAGFLLGLGAAGVDWPVVGAMLAGGLIAAPVAAWLVRLVPAVLLGASVGGVILVTNIRTLLTAFEVGSGARLGTYLVVAAAWMTALGLATRSLLRGRRSTTAPATEPV